jgi:hypothetical protein
MVTGATPVSSKSSRLRTPMLSLPPPPLIVIGTSMPPVPITLRPSSPSPSCTLSRWTRDFGNWASIVPSKPKSTVS